MSKNKKTIIAVITLILLVAAALCIWYFCGPAKDANENMKEISVTVVHADGSKKEFSISTDEQFLRGALEAEKLISGDEGEYGLFVTTVDGEKVDDSRQEWWCFTRGGEMLNTGVDDTAIADGETYEITFTVGYDF